MDYTFKNGETVGVKIHANGGGIVSLNSSVDSDCYVGKRSTVYNSKIHGMGVVSLSHIYDTTLEGSNITNSTVRKSNIQISNVAQSIVDGCELRDTQVMSATLRDSSLKSSHVISSTIQESHIHTAHVIGAVVTGSRLSQGRYADSIDNCDLLNVNTLSGHMTNMDTGRGDRVFSYQGGGFTVSTLKDKCRVSNGRRYIEVTMGRGIKDMMETVKQSLSLDKDQLDEVKLALVVSGVLEYGNKASNFTNFYHSHRESVTMEPDNHGSRLKVHYTRELERLLG